MPFTSNSNNTAPPYESFTGGSTKKQYSYFLYLDCEYDIDIINYDYYYLSNSIKQLILNRLNQPLRL